jgi:hypothetical protein
LISARPSTDVRRRIDRWAEGTLTHLVAAIGTWGSIWTLIVKTDDNGKAISHRAQANFRDHHGHVRLVPAFGRTKTAAERAVLKKLQNRAKTGQGGELTAMHKINHLLDLWITKFKDQIADGTRSPPP